MPRPTVASRRPEHKIWRAIKARCSNPRHRDWPYYGGRGITLFPQWEQSFSAFLAGVGSRPEPTLTLDRINNDKGYEPGNVRWASRVTQQNNVRNNVWITFKGLRKTAGEWARELGVPYNTIRRRADSGHPLDERRTAFRGKRLACPVN